MIPKLAHQPNQFALPTCCIPPRLLFLRPFCTFLAVLYNELSRMLVALSFMSNGTTTSTVLQNAMYTFLPVVTEALDFLRG